MGICLLTENFFTKIRKDYLILMRFQKGTGIAMSNDKEKPQLKLVVFERFHIMSSGLENLNCHI